MMDAGGQTWERGRPAGVLRKAQAESLLPNFSVIYRASTHFPYFRLRRVRGLSARYHFSHAGEDARAPMSGRQINMYKLQTPTARQNRLFQHRLNISSQQDILMNPINGK